MIDPRVAQLEAILSESGSGERKFSEPEIDQLLLYYQLVLKWNRRLHLTTLTQPKQFFQRHIFESVLAASHLILPVRQLWDLGSGLGVPGVPIAVLRPDIQVHLVEAGRNKVIFLEEVVTMLGLANVQVVGSRIESLDPLLDDSCLTARAVEEMEQLLPEILRVGKNGAQILILATEPIRKVVEFGLKRDWRIQSHPIPGTERSLVISAIRST